MCSEMLCIWRAGLTGMLFSTVPYFILFGANRCCDVFKPVPYAALPPDLLARLECKDDIDLRPHMSMAWLECP